MCQFSQVYQTILSYCIHLKYITLIRLKIIEGNFSLLLKKANAKIKIVHNICSDTDFPPPQICELYFGHLHYSANICLNYDTNMFFIAK